MALTPCLSLAPHSPHQASPDPPDLVSSRSPLPISALHMPKSSLSTRVLRAL
ncbi:hypothetical protein PISMIDRAFT_689698 [Pisolithus microcarpus 441]|uniref:Uncharacterized protein n=1 Tax=Pisolithus microcarpus 441 TaxID=765257 RepID=A0A0C9YW85_9AGAM|nr:hypothetical protein PISMIDRAFT_689698 [Pisolithus microcarpus 441]